MLQSAPGIPGKQKETQSFVHRTGFVVIRRQANAELQDISELALSRSDTGIRASLSILLASDRKRGRFIGQYKAIAQLVRVERLGGLLV